MHRKSAIVEYAADGSISLPQLKTVFGMELGTTVTLKHAVKSGGATLIYQIGKIDGSTVSLVGTDEDSSVATTTVGELVDLYKTVKFVEDVIVRAADISPVEAFAEVVAEFIKSSIRVLLQNAFRLHQPTTKVDLKINNDTKQVFAGLDDSAGKLK